MEIRRLGPQDEQLVANAAVLFDGPAVRPATKRFLRDDHHHLLVAYEDGRAVGFVTGVEITHPDKGTEMFVYELSVDEAYQRRGIARALLHELEQLARDLECYGMWVVTSEDNAAALATYQASGATIERAQAVLAWTFESGPASSLK
jgi:ribosomal protein S18 acetylase RimI-like enzyme